MPYDWPKFTFLPAVPHEKCGAKASKCVFGKILFEYQYDGLGDPPERLIRGLLSESQQKATGDS
jgi:hypothetical protein